MTRACACPKNRMNPYRPKRGAMPPDKPKKKHMVHEAPERTDFEMVREEAGLGAQDRAANIMGDSRRAKFPKI